MSVSHALIPYLFGAADAPSPRDVQYARDTRKQHTHERDASTSISTHHSANAEDLDLARGIRAGNTVALESLVQRYADALIRFGMTLTRSRDVAEELAYDAFARVWERREQLRDDRSLAPYLFTTVRHLAAHLAARNRVRMRHAEQVRDAATADVSVRTVQGPDELLVQQEDAAAYTALIATLERTIATLPEPRRLALHLRFTQGLTYPAIGEILGVSDKAAQQLVLRTIGALRRALGVRLN